MSANTGENIQDSNVDAEIEAKKNELEKQIIYYPHAEQIDLNTFSEDVEQIDLSMSRIDKIEDFSRFTNFNSLCFRSNLLKSLASDNLKSSKGFAQIKELDFYDNQIEKIENLDELVTLETLDLSFNRLSKIEKLDSLTNLKKLYFVHNKIAKIENLEKLTQLEMLELGDNQLRQVENLDKLTNLKQLYLGKNKIKRIENLTMQTLEILSLQSNRLTKIENLNHMINLTELYLSENGLKKIEGLENLKKLKTLDLSINEIERIENVECLIELEEFWFSNNNLSKWEDIEVLKQLPKLKCLYLEYNPIYYINNAKPSNIGSLNDLQKMNPNYRRKIILTLPKLEQLDATLCKNPSYV